MADEIMKRRAVAVLRLIRNLTDEGLEAVEKIDCIGTDASRDGAPGECSELNSALDVHLDCVARLVLHKVANMLGTLKPANESGKDGAS